MNQLLFNFDDNNYPKLENFFGRANAELIAMLREDTHRFMLVCGQEGSGKSHLLKAWVLKAIHKGLSAVYVDAQQQLLPENLSGYDCIAIDQIEALDSSGQEKLFDLFNQLTFKNTGNLLLSSSQALNQLTLRKDLQTRVALCLVYELQPLTDEEKLSALMNLAQARQLSIPLEVFQYFLKYWRRDLDSLIQLLEQVSEYAITHQKSMSLHLVRQFLKKANHEFSNI